jgi:hypothetical protein
MEKRFITVTSAYSGSKGAKLTLSVDGIGALKIKDGGQKITILKHTTHNNGGYEVSETPEQILELIMKSKPI